MLVFLLWWQIEYPVDFTDGHVFQSGYPLCFAAFCPLALRVHICKGRNYMKLHSYMDVWIAERATVYMTMLKHLLPFGFIVFSQLPTCDVVHGVERSCVVQVHSKQDHQWHGKGNQQIDWHSKGPVSAKITGNQWIHLTSRVLPLISCNMQFICNLYLFFFLLTFEASKWVLLNEAIPLVQMPTSNTDL